MTCKVCKTSNAETARFCSNCGAELGYRNEPASRAVTQEEEITRQQSVARNQEATLVDFARDGLLGCMIASKYRIDGKLGAGGMGAVYRATRLLIGDEIAVKILHTEQGDPRVAERFRREAQAAARLKHPNAVTIHDFGVTDDGLQYLVMDLVEGASLRQIIKNQGPLTPSAAAEVNTQVCAALEEAHRRNIVHRDIKPDNIIVNVTATGLRVKVLDFGIAKLRDDAAGNLTQAGSILGTPYYMSPEQCLGEELDSRSDIYSLGVVVYEMLTGRVPFTSPVSSAVVVQHVNQPPPSPRALNASISAGVEAVVLHALEKRREARPQSATAFAQELTTAVTHQGTVAAEAVAGPPLNQAASTPTLFVNPQSHSRGVAASRNLRDTSGSAGGSNTVRVVGVTVLATIILLCVGWFGVRMLFSPANERIKASSEPVNAQKEENSPVSQTKRAAAAPAATPVVRPSQAPTVEISSLRRDVLETLDGWAAAVRAHDLETQMSYYADRVDPYFLRHNVTAAEVRANRSPAFTRFYKLDVQLSNIDIGLDQTGTRATATFDKAYSFQGEKFYSGSVRSMLWLTKYGSRWLITGEKDLKVY